MGHVLEKFGKHWCGGSPAVMRVSINCEASSHCNDYSVVYQEGMNGSGNVRNSTRGVGGTDSI